MQLLATLGLQSYYKAKGLLPKYVFMMSAADLDAKVVSGAVGDELFSQLHYKLAIEVALVGFGLQ